MQSSSLRGAFFMIVAVAAFSVMDVTLKRLVETYPAMQVTFLRGAASLPFLLLAAGVSGRWRDLKPRRVPLHFVRAFLGVVTLWFFIYSVKFLSLADAYAIFMSAPLLITALSVPMLGERIGWQRWLAVAAGMLGVIVVLKPSGSSLVTIGGLSALIAAVGYALTAITIRILLRTDTGTATIVWSLFLVTVTAGSIASFDWVPLHWDHWPWIVAVGLFGAIGQHCITHAFRLASAPAIAPIEYTALLWGMLFDWWLWNTMPDARMLSGAAIIVASGLYVILRERHVTVRSNDAG